MPRIVIVGAGPAGINAAQTLGNKLKKKDNTEVVVLEKNEFYYHTVGAPRAYTEAEYTPKMFIPYDKAIPASAAAFVKMIRAVATRVTASEVSFQRIGADGKPATRTETMTFDYLILATGSTYTVPIKQSVDDYSRATTERQLQEVRDQIIKADKILIVGGGAVGCEVAGDIAAHFPTKHVTILEGRDKLVATSNLRDKFRDYLTQALDKLKIQVITGERLTERLTGNSFEKRTLRTDKGTEIESDIQLLCGGFHPVADLVQAMDAAMVDERGAVKVNDLMQLDDPKYAHIFALGDMTNHRTPKLSYLAGEQAKHLGAELVAVIHKKQTAVTKPFPVPTVDTLVMPLGPHGGVSQLPVWGGSVVGDFMTRMIKSSDMFASHTWGAFGATMPQ